MTLGHLTWLPALGHIFVIHHPVFISATIGHLTTYVHCKYVILVVKKCTWKYLPNHQVHGVQVQGLRKSDPNSKYKYNYIKLCTWVRVLVLGPNAEEGKPNERLSDWNEMRENSRISDWVGRYWMTERVHGETWLKQGSDWVGQDGWMTEWLTRETSQLL